MYEGWLLPWALITTLISMLKSHLCCILVQTAWHSTQTLLLINYSTKFRWLKIFHPSMSKGDFLRWQSFMKICCCCCNSWSIPSHPYSITAATDLVLGALAASATTERQGSLYRYSWSLGDKSYWLWRSPDFPSSATSRLMLSFYCLCNWMDCNSVWCRYRDMITWSPFLSSPFWFITKYLPN